MINSSMSGRRHRAAHMRGSIARAIVPLLAASLLAGAAEAAPVRVGDDPVLYWNQVLVRGVVADPLSTSRGYAMVDVAIFDAVNATTGMTRPGYLRTPTPGGDTRAATAVAAHDVLVSLNPAQTSTFDADLKASLALVPAGARKTRGIETGAAIAAAMIANRSNDGSAAVVPYTSTGAPGIYVATPPEFAPAYGTGWGQVKPWLLTSGAQFEPPPPPKPDAPDYVTALNEVRMIGSANSRVRTADQTAAALFWATPEATGNAPWTTTAIAIARKRHLSTVELARMFAVLSTATADASIAIMQSKYAYAFWRPVTAIRRGGAGAKPLWSADPSWLPLLDTPPFPSYVSGHSGVTAASALVLGAFLGDRHAFCIPSSLGRRCFKSFDLAARDTANSRLWGGIHYRFDNSAARALGQRIARFEIGSPAFAPSKTR